MERQDYTILGSNRAKRMLVVAILTIALVVSMVPLGGENVYASDYNLNSDDLGGKWIQGSFSSTNMENNYTFELKHRAPVYISISASVPSISLSPYAVELFYNDSSVAINSYNSPINGATGFYVNNGKLCSPGKYKINLTLNDSMLSKNIDYKFYISNQADLSQSYNLKWALDPGKAQSYTGVPRYFINTVGYHPSGELLAEGIDYKVSYSNGNVNIGKGVITIEGINGFYGSITRNYVIKPSKKTIYTKKSTISSTRPKKRQLKIKWKKISTATHYQIKYRVKGTKKWKSKTVAASKTSLTLKKLKKGKKYQYKVRGVQKLKGYTTYYSKYSKTKTSKKIK